MAKPLIYFDIDKTLIDTKKMLELVRTSVAVVGVPAELFTETVNQYIQSLDSKTYFDPEHLIRRLVSSADSVEENLVRQAFWQQSNFSQALFPEVIQVLNTLQPVTELGVFSQGVRYWQEQKLELSTVTSFFPSHSRVISLDKLSQHSLAQLQPNSWVVDDKVEVVEQLRKVRPDLTVLQVRRDQHPAVSGVVASLSEVVEQLLGR